MSRYWPGQGQQGGAFCVQEQHIQGIGEEEDDPQRRRCVNSSQDGAGAQPLVQPLPLGGPHILPAVGGLVAPMASKGQHRNMETLLAAVTAVT